ncbi:MAG: transposase [Lewinellaceae bacterium]|nr:transposase [Lewinellaceae bacterium]
MMLKGPLVYGYVDKRYSSRDIEKALQENLCYMWLCGMQKPDHNTLNRFRNSRLKQTVKAVFAHVLAMLVEQGYVRLEEYYVDGTKLESVAGRYTYVWAKNVERYKAYLLEKIAQVIEQIEVPMNIPRQKQLRNKPRLPSRLLVIVRRFKKQLNV